MSSLPPNAGNLLTPSAPDTAPPLSQQTPPAAQGGTVGKGCQVEQLRMSLTAIQGATGNEVAGFGITNISTTPCTLYGYPGLQLVSSNGKPLPTHVTRNPSRSPQLVTLHPGGAGQFSMQYQSFDPQTTYPCQPVAARVLVIPPNETRQISVSAMPPSGPARVNPCNGNVLVSSVVAS